MKTALKRIHNKNTGDVYVLRGRSTEITNTGDVKGRWTERLERVERPGMKEFKKWGF